LLVLPIISGLGQPQNKVFSFSSIARRYGIKSSVHANSQRKGSSISTSATTGMNGGVPELSESEQDMKHYMWPDKKV